MPVFWDIEEIGAFFAIVSRFYPGGLLGFALRMRYFGGHVRVDEYFKCTLSTKRRIVIPCVDVSFCW
jgi:hypothetical protein